MKRPGDDRRPRQKQRGSEQRGSEQRGSRAQERRPARADQSSGSVEQVEGRRAVRELLVARRRPVREVYLVRDLSSSSIIDEIVELAEELQVPLRKVSHEQLSGMARTEAPQGVLAHAAPLPLADFDVLIANPEAFLVALDGVTDPRNLGAVARSAEGAGATGLVIPKQRSVQITPTVAKAAAGAIEHMDLAMVAGIPAALERARRAGVWVVGLDEAGDQDIFELSLADQPIMLLLGAEGSGISRLARERCDLLLRIPMRGMLDSLNVASAATLACYEVARRRTSK